MIRTKDELNEFIRSQRSEENYASLPLSGVRVIDMSTIVAAPSAAMLLGDVGAEVIKIENPSIPDGLRAWSVVEENGIQPYYAVIGRNKFPVTANLKSSDGKQIFFELIKHSDVFIENMRPGAMDKLGLGIDELMQVNPGLIIGKVSGYGQTGPYAMKPGFGTLAEAFSGFSFLNAHPGGPPTSPPMALADFITGLHLAFAVVVALRSQKRGESGGQVIDISLYEPLFSLLGAEFLSYYLTGEVPQPIGNELRGAAPRNNYRTKEGDWIALSCSSQMTWERLAGAMERQDMIKDPRFLTNEQRITPESRKILNETIQDWIGSKGTREFLDICTQLGLTAGPIPNMKGIDEDPHYQERRTLINIEDPLTGIMLKMPEIGYRMLGTPGKIRFAGLPHGSANDVILQDLLGYKPEDIERFKQEKSI
jgi:crotonobetainyl-CoA:carnitine CoA-transferase CaiB-like acyl-CoA transferase